MPARPSAALVRIVVGTRSIVALFAHEQPPVRAGEWDAQGYAAQRAAAWREALQAALAARGTRLEVAVDAGLPASLDGIAEAGTEANPGTDAAPATTLLIGSDRIAVMAPAADAHELVRIGEGAARPLAADSGGWRRFLQPAWFERHRAWRREVGSPIKH